MLHELTFKLDQLMQAGQLQFFFASERNSILAFC